MLRLAPRQLRQLTLSARVLAKNDASTIDSFRLPSQTSINEWEFKYDFMPKVAEPKIPPVSPEAVKQDIAQNKKQQVETELFIRELNSSVKVEANDATVLRGGVAVSAEPEYLHDRGLDPVDALHSKPVQPGKKTANTAKYVQLSLNPEINQPTVVSFADRAVDHKIGTVETPEVEDAEAAPQARRTSPFVVVGLLGAGAAAGYYMFGRKPAAPAAKA